ncbi:response regulator transcription factor [Stenotrophomonas rhizophila]|nr:response regulator transcription factor [Stenotrophomonas rhizophila]MCC7664166.1 response regulator transcription factor [Stenotrophomonas rhizophila]
MILDDHEVVLHGLRQCLSTEADIELRGFCSTSRELLNVLATRTADILIIDFMLGPQDVDGINLIKVLKLRFPSCKLLVLSAQYTPATAALVLHAGAHGFIGKSLPLDDVASAVRAVARGQIYLTRDMAMELAEFSESALRPATVPGNAEHTPLLASPLLSPREREVLRCCLDGMSVAQIAGKFSRSSNTISTQKQSAFRKIGIRNDNELFKMRNQLDRP